MHAVTVQMFSLRKVTIKGSNKAGRVSATIYVYCNYRKTIKGVVDVSDPKIKGCKREYAKRQVQKLQPNADFWR